MPIKVIKLLLFHSDLTATVQGTKTKQLSAHVTAATSRTLNPPLSDTHSSAHITKDYPFLQGHHLIQCISMWNVNPNPENVHPTGLVSKAAQQKAEIRLEKASTTPCPRYPKQVGVCLGWEQSLLTPAPKSNKETAQLEEVIPDCLDRARVQEAEEKPMQHLLSQTHNVNLGPRPPRAFRLNAPSGVRWNKWDGRGGQWERERERGKPEGGGLKAVEMTEEAGLHGRGLNLGGGDYLRLLGLSVTPLHLF